MIAGLEYITAGEIIIGDRLINDVPPRDRNIAMVFQNDALYPHMTVFENMSFGLRLRKIRKDEISQRVQEAAEILDNGELLARRPKQLSGGQRQRVAMGRAIVRNPEAFLFDEPLSNLDAKLRVQMRTEIKRIHQRVRTTVVYVTHDQVEAITLADRIVVMNDGIVEQVASPQEMYDRPRTRFVAGFIGSPAMNFLPCKLTQNGSGLCVSLSEQIRLNVPGGHDGIHEYRGCRGVCESGAPGGQERWRRDDVHDRYAEHALDRSGVGQHPVGARFVAALTGKDSWTRQRRVVSDDVKII